MLGLQLLQIIRCVHSGEVVQVAGRACYGPLFGTLIILLAASFPVGFFTRWFTSWEPPSFGPWWTKALGEVLRVRALGEIKYIVLVLPCSMPKDVLASDLPLPTCACVRSWSFRPWGISGVIISTYAAAGLAEGDITTSLIIFGIAAVLMILGIIFRDKIMSVLGTQRALHKMDKETRRKAGRKTLRESLQQEDEKRVE